VYVNITINVNIGRINKEFIQMLTVHHFCWLNFSTAVEKNWCEHAWFMCECVVEPCLVNAGLQWFSIDNIQKVSH